MFTCQLGRYRYKQLPFGAAPSVDMFQRNIDEILKDLPNVFGIADDILVSGLKLMAKIMKKQEGGFYRDVHRLMWIKTKISIISGVHQSYFVGKLYHCM